MNTAYVLAARDEYRLQSWTKIIHECRTSGLTDKEFCAQRGITEKLYYSWLRKVRIAASAAMEPQLVRLEKGFVNGKDQLIKVRYSKTELKLPEDVDLKALAVFRNALQRYN